MSSSIRPSRLLASGLAALPLLAGAPALADQPLGSWIRDTGGSRVRVTQCGEALCGHITWLRDPSGPSKVGQRVLFDMKPAGPGKWDGKAFNPEDGKTYSGTMSLSGDTLTTAGCVLGGLICRSVKWNRSQ